VSCFSLAVFLSVGKVAMESTDFLH
jgi:hypothetical protein